MKADAVLDLIREIDSYLAAHTCKGAAETRQKLMAAGKAAIRDVSPQHSPVCSENLPLALAELRAAGQVSLADAIGLAAPELRWVTYDAYPRADIGEFADRHAFASLIGEDAPLAAEDFDFGLFVIAPNTFYRDHHHAAPELYVPLTGPHGWRFSVDAPFINKPAHQPVWNEPWQVHATMTGAVPFLCIFAWLKDVNQPAAICA